jgi:hypothetical protein
MHFEGFDIGKAASSRDPTVLQTFPKNGLLSFAKLNDIVLRIIWSVTGA